jgi:hypothetical protein
MLVAIIIPDHDGCCVKTFTQHLKSEGWCISKFDNVSFPSINDTIAGCCDLVIGVHSSCTSCIQPLGLKMSLHVSPHPIGAFIWEPFNRPEQHLVSLACNNNGFCCQDVKFTTTKPSSEVQLAKGVIVKYFLHGHGSNKSTLCGFAVISTDGLCPPFDAGIEGSRDQGIHASDTLCHSNLIPHNQ